MVVEHGTVLPDGGTRVNKSSGFSGQACGQSKAVRPTGGSAFRADTKPRHGAGDNDAALIAQLRADDDIAIASFADPGTRGQCAGPGGLEKAGIEAHGHSGAVRIKGCERASTGRRIQHGRKEAALNGAVPVRK